MISKWYVFKWIHVAYDSIGAVLGCLVTTLTVIF